MPLKVLSYNILDGGGDRLPRIVALIREQQPDAVALLEANSRVNAESLASDLEMTLAYGEANSEYAVAWLSRLPIERAQNHRHSIFVKTLIEVELLWQGRPLSLFATHLKAGRTQADAERRVQEVEVILERCHALAEAPHLLVGDFNAVHPGDRVGTPPAGETQGYVARQPIQMLLDAGYVDCYRQMHPNRPGYTYPAHHPWLRIDYIFASPSLAAYLVASDLIIQERQGLSSDHFAVWAEFA
jgi:endonuclease/exonuclease/phosphatase family metal-dependent hydrolase